MTRRPIKADHRRQIPHTPAIARCLALAFCVLFAGCGGDDWEVATYPAQGRILINGEPPAGAVLELHAVGDEPDVRNSRPWAIVQDNGSFTLTTYESGDGAPAGEYAVTVRWPPDVAQPSLADRLGGAYATVERSPSKVTISRGENLIPPIEIEKAKVQSKEAMSAPSALPPGPPLGGSP